jgi:hypothetical protein
MAAKVLKPRLGKRLFRASTRPIAQGGRKACTSHLLKIRNKAANAAVYQNQLPIFYDKRLSGKNPPACNRQS